MGIGLDWVEGEKNSECCRGCWGENMEISIHIHFQNVPAQLQFLKSYHDNVQTASVED
jgi:hypothetical protein